MGIELLIWLILGNGPFFFFFFSVLRFRNKNPSFPLLLLQFRPDVVFLFCSVSIHPFKPLIASPKERLKPIIDHKIFINIQLMAAKILANLIVMGSGILARAVVQAYHQALTNALKTGVAQETIRNGVRRASKIMTEQEARQILGITERSTWEEIAQKYDNLFENNAKNGSFYLQSKVHRAKECLEPLYQHKDQGTST
ncbi:unnamed protein product [Camellia sinensis]